jgi:hypothetical protein
MHTDSQKTWLAHLAEDRRYAAMVGLGISSGLPFLLVYSTQSAWLSEAGVPIETIGLLSELTIAYKFKFVWSPFLDRYDPPLLASLVGRRRGWIVVSQIAVIGVGRGRLRRSRALDCVDGRRVTRPRLCRRHAGRDRRRLAHHGGATRQAIAHDCLFGGRLSLRHARGGCRCTHRRRSIRVARSLYVHGRADDDRCAIRHFRARARI